MAAEHLKELIFIVKGGFNDMRDGFKEMSVKQDDLIETVKEAREDIVDEVAGLRSDLKGRMEERLQRIEGDVVEIKARMKS